MTTISCIIILSIIVFIIVVIFFAYKSGINKQKAQLVDVQINNNKILNNMNETLANNTSKEDLAESLKKGDF